MSFEHIALNHNAAVKTEEQSMDKKSCREKKRLTGQWPASQVRWQQTLPPKTGPRSPKSDPKVGTGAPMCTQLAPNGRRMAPNGLPNGANGHPDVRNLTSGCPPDQNWCQSGTKSGQWVHKRAPNCGQSCTKVAQWAPKATQGRKSPPLAV